MRKKIAILCVVCLIVPALTIADQSSAPNLAEMLQEGTLTPKELQSIVLADMSDEDVQTLVDELNAVITSDLRTYSCYYFAYLVIRNLLDCLVYKYIPSCEGWVMWALVYYLVCV